MKLTKKLETEILKTYNTYWDSYFKGDMKTFATYLDANCHIIGSTEFDVFKNKKSAVEFYSKTADQITGKAEFKNRKISMLVSGENVMVEEFCDFYFLANDEWKFYGHCRLSILFSEKESGWKIIYQHGSMPDSKAQEGEQIAAKEVAEENKKLRNAIKRRTVELESKNRDLEIEAALEKVRSRTMAMQKSEELAETSFVLFQQFKKLGETSEQISIGIFNEEENIMELYSTLHGSQWKDAASVDLDEPVVMKKIYTAWKKRKKSIVIDLKGSELKNYNKYRKSLSGLDYKEKRWVIHVAFFSKGVLTFSATEPLPKETVQLLERFAAVFDGTYTRFLDLQKAEAQAREAKIETALERVRAVAMSMKKSEEVLKVCEVMYNELLALGFTNIRNAQIALKDQDKRSYLICAYSNSEVVTLQEAPYNSSPIVKELYDELEKSKDAFYQREFSGKQFKNWRKWRESLYPVSDIKEGSVTSLCFYLYSIGTGHLGISTYNTITAEQVEVLKRFKNVFELSYTRYIDVAKAESQARESQIQLALERVRARTMAMQKSSELQDAAILLFDQIKSLDIPTGSCGFNIWNNNEWATVWVSSPEGGMQAPFEMPHTESPIYKKVLISKKKGEQLLISEVGGEELKKHFDYLITVPGIGDRIKKLRAANYHFPEKINYYFAFFNQGYLSFHVHELHPEAGEIFVRFATVFEQTYTRFLDLQKAEAQTQEARIETALERVRAIAMAMRKPEELAGIGETLFTELKALDFADLRNTEIVINNDTKETIKSYYYSDYGITGIIEMDYKTNPILQKWTDDLKKADDAFAEVIVTESEMKEWIKYRESIGYLPDPKLNKAKSVFYYSYSIGLGALSISSFAPVAADQIKILERFRNVFNLSYQRYIDIAQAEAQAREAQIQLALERIRARTMAMQHSNELQEVVNNVYERLDELEVEMDGAAICTFIEGSKDYHVWIGGLPERLLIKFNDLTQVQRDYNDAIERRDELFTKTYSGKIKKEYIRFLLEQTVLKSTLPEEQKQRLLASDFFTTVIACTRNTAFQLYRYNGKSFLNEETEILKRFAKVFEQAYIRFLDLQKAEAQAREAQIELGLERVRARAMAMQKSDELADVATLLFQQFKSLGLLPETARVFFNLIDEKAESTETWTTREDGVLRPGSHQIPLNLNKHLKDMYTAWKTKKPIYISELEGKELIWYLNYLSSLPSVAEDKTLQQLLLSPPEKLVFTEAIFKQGTIGIISAESLLPEPINTLTRFSVVFEQTYTRFLDLQKAEAQARESKIELSLERVRSRSMAMHKSNELKEAGELLWDELGKLGIPSLSSGYVLMDKDEKIGWTYAPNPATGKIAEPLGCLHTETKEMLAVLSAWKKQYPLSVIEMDEQETIAHQTFIAERALNLDGTICQWITGEQLIALSPKRLFLHNFNFKEGYLLIVGGNRLTDEQKELMLRFTKVFQQTYTRFLDLKKAEAQTRESQIQLALERVRARTMAMQKSDELQDAAMLLFRQVEALNVTVFATGFNIWNSDRKSAISWMAGEDRLQPPFETSSSEDIFKKIYEAGSRGELLFVEEQQGEALKTHYDYLKSLSVFKEVADKMEAAGQLLPDYQIMHCAFFSQGYLMFISFEQVPEAHDIFKRFAKVFEQTYTRFLDLQKAEAQAREAQIELSLERVRAKAMAMQSSDELSDVLAVLFEQFDVLGIWPVDTHLDLFDFEKNIFIYRATGKKGARVIAEQIVDLDSRPEWQALAEKWKKSKPNSIDLSFYPKEVIRELMDFFPDIWAAMPENAIMDPEDFPDGMFDTLGYHKFGYLGFHHHRKATEEEKNVLIRFANEFERLYQRFLDLQKAEAQAREATIEAALERVRSKTMAMHNSQDVAESVSTLFDEVTKLGIATIRCGIGIMHDAGQMELWTAKTNGKGKTDLVIGHMDMTMHPLLQGGYDGWKNKEKFYSYELKGDDLINYYTIINNHPDYPVRYELSSLPAATIHSEFYFPEGTLYSFSLEELSAESKKIFNRFAGVFGQTYRRYLDLRKAEAQAREAQIEAALERVRARTMAMQHSDELPAAANLLFQQVQSLGMPAWSAGYCIWDEDKKATTLWMSSEGVLQPPFKAPLTEDPSFMHMREAYERGETFFVEEVGGEELVKHYKYMRTLPVVGEILDSIIEAGHPLPTFQIFHLAYFSQGFLLFITYEPVLSAHDIFKRFAKVFDQTYTRFLDLQKAEAQAREAEIELALERVRARTMAMQHSEELADASLLLDQQVRALGLKTWGCAFNIYGEKESTEWFSNEMGTMQTYKTPREKIFLRYYEAGQKGETLLVKEFSGKECVDWYNYLCTLPGIGDGLKQMRAAGGSFPTQQIDHVSFFKYGYLLFITLEHVPEAYEIFKRFAKVFEQTYTRFLDLQKAEAQARESQIQLALERVRARTMAMQKSDEMSETAALLFKQISDLGIETWTSGFNIWQKHDNSFIGYNPSPTGGITPPYVIPSSEDAFFLRILQAKQRGEASIIFDWSDEHLAETYKYMKTLPVIGDVLKGFEASGISLPTSQVNHCIFFAQGFLLFITQKPYPEAHDIFKRFGKTFEQTYTRFLDLQKAEAQARESQIQLALERVRARTMAMQKSDELSETVYVLFQQFKELGENPDQATIGIINEDENVIEYWVTMYGNPINKVFKFSIDEPNVTHKIYKAWKGNKKSLVIDLSGKALTEFMAYRSNKGGAAVKPDEKRRIINVAFFSKGLLNVQSNEERSDESIKLLERFAAVFEQTYTRFLDLKNAEAQVRESEIELALERVRARTMAMQKSEELKEVIQLVYGQFIHLNINIGHTGFLIDYKERDDLHIWLADEHLVPSEATIPCFDCIPNNRIKEAKEKGQDFFKYDLSFEQKNDFYRDLFKFIPGVPEETLKYYLNCPGLAGSGVLLDNIGLYIENFSGTPYSDGENKILMRFGKVFQQTYTRFLDLQKAEAQSREAQIEAALEKVRGKAMAMQNSNDLSVTASMVFTELRKLGINPIRCGFGSLHKDSRRAQLYSATSSAGGDSLSLVGWVELSGHPVLETIYDSWLRNEEYYPELIGEQLKLYYESLLAGLPVPLPDWQNGQKQYGNFFPFSVGCLYAWSEEKYNDDQIKILKRFASIIDLTFRRYLDLQKAEAQARESQIQLALERVRARTMAMQHSDDLAETSFLMAKQIRELGIEAWGCGFHIYADNEESDYEWFSTEEGYLTFYKTPREKFYLRFHEKQKNGETLYVEELKGEACEEHYKYLMTIPVVGDSLRNLRDSGIQLPTSQIDHIAYFKHGYLLFVTYEPVPEAYEIFKRFAKEFEQTYTRFLDLQKAEEQAREAQIEAALEKVRSRTLAMQESDELAEASAVLFQQLIHLGIEPNRLYIGITEENSAEIEFWITDEDGSKVSTMFKGDASKNVSMKKMVDGWKQQKKSIVVEMQGKELEEYFHYLGEELHVPFQGGLSQKRRWQYIAYFSKGFIGMASPEEQPAETLHLLERFAYVFNLTFTRFNDLKIAEAHAIKAEQDLNEIKTARKKAEDTLGELQATQKQLIQSEKMASLGELTAGIAHEIQNPLNFVNNFSEVNTELIDELQQEVDRGNYEDVKAIANDIKENEQKINHHGKRAGDIVKGMLQHSRISTGVKEPININTLADEYLRLSYHGLRAKDKDFNATMNTHFDESIGKINIIPQDIGRVLLNLYNNAFYAVNEQKSKNLISYEPTVSVTTKRSDNHVIITVSDNGNGIPQKIVDKIFQPFFTTKPTGQGTGLGLSLSYDIVKAHGGEIKVESKEGEGSTFIIQLTIN